MLARAETVAAALYLRLAEPMPEDAADQWFLGRDPMLDALDMNRVGRFVVEVENMMYDLEELVLEEGPASPQYMSVVYNAGRRVFDDDSRQLRTFFMWLYAIVFHRAEGPRWGDFIAVYGVSEFNQLLRDRFRELI